MIAIEEYTEADDTEAHTYRRQSDECRAAMHAALAGGWPHAAVVLAVQATRTAANAVLATRAGISATGHGADPIELLYLHVPRYRHNQALSLGAEVLALEEDLNYYGLELSSTEAQHMLALTERFCAWTKGA